MGLAFLKQESKIWLHDPTLIFRFRNFSSTVAWFRSSPIWPKQGLTRHRQQLGLPATLSNLWCRRITNCAAKFFLDPVRGSTNDKIKCRIFCDSWIWKKKLAEYISICALETAWSTISHWLAVTLRQMWTYGGERERAFFPSLAKLQDHPSNVVVLNCRIKYDIPLYTCIPLIFQLYLRWVETNSSEITQLEYPVRMRPYRAFHILYGSFSWVSCFIGVGSFGV